MIGFGQFAPDQPEFEKPGTGMARNVMPGGGGSGTFYRPLPSLVATGAALAARPTGAFSCRSFSGVVDIIGGTDTKLYRFSSLTWDDITRTGDDYDGSDTGRWKFVQFGNYVIATNGVDEMQVVSIGSGDFADITGGTANPPIMKYIATVGDFLMGANEVSAEQRIQWPGINTYDDWGSSPATDQSDEQDLPDGGAITGLVGGEFAVVLQERAIRIGTYAGPPVIFRFDKIDDQHGCNLPGSVAGYRGVTFFASYDGFYMVQGGQVIPIGHERVDKWFWSQIDDSNLHRVTSTICPTTGCYLLSFPSTGAMTGNPDRLLIYNWKSDRWSYGEFDHAMIFHAYTETGYDLDDIGTALPSDNIDASSINVDSPDYTGSDKITTAAFTTDFKLGRFTGFPLEAVLDTTEAQISPGRRSLVTEAWIYVDGGTPTMTPITRNRIQDAPMIGSPVAVNATGFAPLRSDARYHRGRVTIPSGAIWNTAQGVDFRARQSASR